MIKYQTVAKVLTLLSSPVVQDGSSVIAEALMRKAMGLSTNTFELVRLNNLHFIKGCQHCLYCRQNETCWINDDLSSILDKFTKADVIVASTPLFLGRAISQYGILEDRLFSFTSEKGSELLKGKKFVTIVTSENEDKNEAEAAEKKISSFLEQLGLTKIGAIVHVNTISDPLQISKEVKKKVEEIGETI